MKLTNKTLSAQVKEAVSDMIRKSEFMDKLPSEQDLAAQLGVSRMKAWSYPATGSARLLHAITAAKISVTISQLWTAPQRSSRNTAMCPVPRVCLWMYVWPALRYPNAWAAIPL